MILGSVYLIVRDFNKSIEFYENLLQMKVTTKNMERFAQFMFDGHNISILNGYYDKQNPDKVVYTGEKIKEFDDLESIANADNTHKIVLNFGTNDLIRERERIILFANNVSGIKCVNAGRGDYWYFNLADPDGNIIEITGNIM